MSWLNDLLEQHAELESPTNFWRWSALAALSAVLKDNIYLDKFAYKLYPNIYVMLHADSGQRKGPPVSMAKQLVRTVNNTKVISGRSSIQGILKELGTSRSLPGGKVESVSSAFICSSELSASIVEDKAVIQILTDLYDRNYNTGDWDSLLKLEKFSLKSPVISMLTATNPAMSEDFLTKIAVQGGLVARTFVIHENHRQSINSLMFPMKKVIDYKTTSEYLTEVSKISGELEIANVDRIYFDEWYKEFVHEMDANQVKDKTGTMNRFDDSVLKVAVLYSLAAQPTKIITRAAIDLAIEQCTKLVGNARRATLGAGKSTWANEKSLILQVLVEREGHAISRQMLNKQYWATANSNEWDEIMNSLLVAGLVTTEQYGSQLMFVMPEKIVQEWNNHFKGK